VSRSFVNTGPQDITTHRFVWSLAVVFCTSKVIAYDFPIRFHVLQFHSRAALRDQQKGLTDDTSDKTEARMTANQRVEIKQTPRLVLRCQLGSKTHKPESAVNKAPARMTPSLVSLSRSAYTLRADASSSEPINSPAPPMPRVCATQPK